MKKSITTLYSPDSANLALAYNKSDRSLQTFLGVATPLDSYIFEANDITNSASLPSMNRRNDIDNCASVPPTDRSSQMEELEQTMDRIGRALHLVQPGHTVSVETEDDFYPRPIDEACVRGVHSLPLMDSFRQVFREDTTRLESMSNDIREIFTRKEDELGTKPMASQRTAPNKKRKMEARARINSNDDMVFKVEGSDRASRKKPRTSVAVAASLALQSMKEDEAYASYDSEDASSVTTARQNQSSQWKEKYEELCKFHKEHGHTNVPPKYNNDPSLWRWVKRQRYQYRLKQDGRKPNAIADDRVAALESLGFVWDSQGTLWMERLKELAQYRQVNGNCNVPSKYPPNHQLSTWVKCQRRQHKLYKEGQNSNMTPERIEALLKLGFVFEPRAKGK